MKRFAAAVLLILASVFTQSPLQAQGAPVQTLWTIVGASETSVDFSVLVRNTQGYDPSRVYGIQSLFVSYDGPTNSLCTNFYCDWSISVSVFGNVDTQPMSIGSSIAPFSLVPLQFSYSGNHESAHFGPPSALGSDTWGILGCQRVQNWPFPNFASFAGRTCAAEGYTGAIAYDLSFNTGGIIDARTLTSDQFTIGAGGSYVNLVTPEPSTYAMVGLSLLCVGAMVRRHSVANNTKPQLTA